MRFPRDQYSPTQHFVSDPKSHPGTYIALTARDYHTADCVDPTILSPPQALVISLFLHSSHGLSVNAASG